MIKRLLLFAALLLPCTPAVAQIVAWQYQNITLAAPTTTVVKSSRGYLHAICINTAGSGTTVTIYDNATTGAGTKLGTITTVAGKVGCQLFDTQFWVGLTVVTGTTPSDITVSFR